MGMRLPNAALMYGRCKVNVLMVDYRGYGSSTGKPSERGLQLDALAVVEFAKKHPRLANSKLVVFGRSLGGAVALWVADSKPELIGGVILENTFLSISDMVDSIMPFLAPFKFLVLRIKWKSCDTITRVKQPILFVSGLRDELVPPHHMQKLASLATSAAFTTFKSVQDGRHNDTFQRAGIAYYTWLKVFFDTLTGGSGADACDDDSTTTCFPPPYRGTVIDDTADVALPTMGRNFVVH
jgi:fermentation-respiration switch protein FrsA (DUF1100 family)